MTATDQDDGILRRHLVQVVAQRETLLFQLRLVPVAVGKDHVAGLRLLDASADGRVDVSERARPGQVDPGPTTRTMQVVVHESRDDGVAFQIDDASGGTGEGPELIFVAGGEDAVSRDRHALGYREVAIDGDDLAVDQQEIGGRWARQRSLG